MNPMDIVPPMPWWYSLLPFIIFGAVVLGVIFLIVLGVLINRRVTMAMRTGGAGVLTLASIILLSGLWCMLLSPPVTYSETKESLYRRIEIPALQSWDYSFDIRERDSLDGSVDGIRLYEDSETSGKAFNLLIYDPDDKIMWSETNITYTYVNIKSLRSGVHKVEVQNINEERMECHVEITVRSKVTYRPLEPFGQWLSLISLPIFGLGMWASGLLTIIQKKEKKGQANIHA